MPDLRDGQGNHSGRGLVAGALVLVLALIVVVVILLATGNQIANIVTNVIVTFR